jgi:hypothetical protein
MTIETALKELVIKNYITLKPPWHEVGDEIIGKFTKTPKSF